MSSQNSAALAEKAAQYVWFHSIDLGNGVVTQGSKTPAIHAMELSAFLDPVDFQRRSVIDIGAWNGLYSFEAKRRGAARVLATDQYVWRHEKFRGREAFEMARESLKLDVDAMEIDVMDLTPERVGTHDIVLFLGVFYHLYDPIRGLGKAARLAKDVLIVETAIALDELPWPAMRFFPGRELNDDASNWWAPNPRCMVDLLHGLGFTTIDATWHPLGRGRAIFHAWRNIDARKDEPPLDRQIELSAGTIPNAEMFERLSPRRKIRLGWRLIRRGMRGR